MESTSYIKVNCDLAIHPDGWAGDDWDGETWYFYIYDYENHDYIEITESQFLSFTSATGDPVPLIATKSLEEITREIGY